jgi:hypothetical protein
VQVVQAVSIKEPKEGFRKDSMSSFFVRKNRKPNSFRVIEESWKDGKKEQKTVPVAAYEALGIRPDMTFEELYVRVKQLNQSNSIERRKAAEAARRLASTRVVESVFVPEDLAEEFYERLKEATFGSEAHNRRILSHWQYVQRMLVKLEIEPVDYAERSKAFYKYFIDKSNSLNYANKLLRIVNMWGAFVCRKRGQFFEPIKSPKGKIRESINDSYFESDNFVGESDPLPPALLENRREKLVVPGNYAWLYISVWFGLRPEEVDSLHDPKRWRVEYRGEKQILWVYQSKLTSIEREKRWKGIPCIYPEQVAALEMISSQKFKRPLYQTMNKVFGTDITLYGGRKNFEDMMLDRGHTLEDISMWMGHQNIQTTWTKYRNRKRIGRF